MHIVFSVLEFCRNELLLFAGIGIILGGLDDLAFDIIYACRRLWRNLFIYSRFPRMTADDLPPPGHAGPVAIFIPAWNEARVIGPMLRRCLTLWAEEAIQIFVGVYPNDKATMDAMVAVLADQGAEKVTIVINPRPGPTTKADCLNQLWAALLRWEREREEMALAVILHDAEDVVHADALRLIASLIPRFAMVQLPVLPLVTKGSHWIAGHYCDEFAETHGKALLVREAIGAGLPSAGVGCGFNRAALGKIAVARGNQPFDPQSLTEDYELGLTICTDSMRGILVRMRDGQGQLIATREFFPDTLTASVKQKSRWMIGIALAGWDRLGWSGGWREHWMRLRDRRALLAALILAAAYLGLVLGACLLIIRWVSDTSGSAWPPLLVTILQINLVMLLWRLAIRMIFVWRTYGVLEGLRSVPRAIVANIIAMMAARRALLTYIGLLRGEALVWDKTEHRFPDEESMP